MATRTWNPGAVGDWFDADNWTTAPPDPNDYPLPGDTVAVPSGTAIVEAGNGVLPVVDDLQVTLGGPLNAGEPVVLEAISAAFSGVGLTVADGPGGWATPLDATFLARGATGFTGRIAVEPHGGVLTIAVRRGDGLPGELTLGGSGTGERGLVAVTQDSALRLRGGGDLVNEGFIQVEGVAEVGARMSILGSGLIELENGGCMLVKGSVGAGQLVVMPDGHATLTLADPDGFAGTIGLAQYGGSRIDLPSTDARSLGLSDSVLTLYSGRSQTGEVVARLPVKLINPGDLAPLPTDQQTLTAQDFTLDDLGRRGARITHTPQGPQYSEASLPVPVVAETGSLVALSDILEGAFGTATPGFYAITLLPTTVASDPEYFWGQPPNGEAVPPRWYVNGELVTAPATVTAGGDIQLLVGNNINDPAQIQVQVTPDATGNRAEYVTYSLWTTDPAVEQKVLDAGMVPGRPTPADIVAAAMAYNSAFPGVLNSNLCNWIGDDVAAAAGATMPLPDAALDPSLNVEGGFWRIAYRGSASTEPVENWGALVRPGDIVRLEWAATGSGHTTTVLGALDGGGMITVYDNDDVVGGQHTIGIHQADYWTATTPLGITIYRLDPDQRYLIQGTKLGEFIQGSVFDDLIRPGGGKDAIALGPGDDLVQGRAAELHGITLTGLGEGDGLDLTDLDPARTVVSYGGGGTATLRILSDGQRVAAITLPALQQGEHFIVGSDGVGGTLIEIVSLGTGASGTGGLLLA